MLLVTNKVCRGNHSRAYFFKNLLFIGKKNIKRDERFGRFEFLEESVSNFPLSQFPLTAQAINGEEKEKKNATFEIIVDIFLLVF